MYGFRCVSRLQRFQFLLVHQLNLSLSATNTNKSAIENGCLSLKKTNWGSNFGRFKSTDNRAGMSALDDRHDLTTEVKEALEVDEILNEPPVCEESATVNNDNNSDLAQTEAPGATHKLESTTTTTSKPVSKRSLKRQARAQRYKDLKKRRKAENLIQTGREEAGYSLGEFDKTTYYFENGLRKVYPYQYVFATYAKERWVGRTLKEVLEREFGFDKPEDVDKAFHEGKIHVNGVQAAIDYVVKDCHYISHQIHRHENPVTDSPLEILADNQDVVVINKPSSIPCHPCGRYRFNSVVFILGKEMGYSNLRNIYRLDRLTSGVLVLGKTAKATKRLEDQVVKREVHKEYLCRVEGEFPSEPQTVEQPLEALSNKLRLQVVAPSGKASQTTFTRLSYNGRSSVVKCVPRTGRTHQIRVHLQYLGYPIINDVFYNSSAWGPNKGKGGVYEVNHDIVCSRISQSHAATLWEGGENPLFHRKLEEMERQQSHTVANLNQDQKNLPQTEDKKISSDSTPKANLKAVDGVTLCDSKSDSLVDTDSDSVRIKATQSSSPVSNETLSSDLKSDNGDVKVDRSNSSYPMLDPCSIQKDELESNESPPGMEMGDSNPSGGSMETNAVSGNCKSTLESSRPGFEWAKWQIERTCDMCRKTTLDPRARDLVMFLHAWKYKGPDWEYQTEMPDWAREDWADEDQFVLEEPTYDNDR